MQAYTERNFLVESIVAVDVVALPRSLPPLLLSLQLTLSAGSLQSSRGWLCIAVAPKCNSALAAGVDADNACLSLKLSTLCE